MKLSEIQQTALVKINTTGTTVCLKREFKHESLYPVACFPDDLLHAVVTFA
jgi:hypothetical protein